MKSEELAGAVGEFLSHGKNEKNGNGDAMRGRRLARCEGMGRFNCGLKRRFGLDTPPAQPFQGILNGWIMLGFPVISCSYTFHNQWVKVLYWTFSPTLVGQRYKKGVV